MRSILFSLPVVFLARTTLAAGTCYSPNGTELDSGYKEYQPCTSGPSSICCGINRINPPGGNSSDGFTQDECLPNGLCQNRITVDGVEKTSWWVDFCAESDPDSSLCLNNICDQGRGGFGNTPLTPCTGRADSQKWCCGDNNGCCTSNVGVVRLAQVLGGSLSSEVSSATSSATSRTSSAASTTLATASSASSTGTGASASATSGTSGTTVEKSGLSGGAIAGIVIGAVAGLALLAVAIFFARKAAKYKKRAATSGTSNYVEAPPGYPAQHPDQGHIVPGTEKYAQQNQHTQGYGHHAPLSELPPAPPSELPSGMPSEPALPRQ